MKRLMAKLFHGVQNRIFFAFSAFFILVTLLLSLLISGYVAGVVNQQNHASMQSLSAQMAGSIDNYIDSIKDSLNGLLVGNTVTRVVNNEHTSTFARYRNMFTYYDAAASILKSESFDTNQIYLVLAEDGVIFTSNSRHLLPVGPTAPWLQALKDNRPYTSYLRNFTPPKKMQDEMLFTIGISVADNAYWYVSQEAYLLMAVGRSRLTYVLKQLDNMPFSALVLTDTAGETMYSYGTTAQIAQLDTAQYRPYAAPIRNNAWTLTLYYDKNAESEPIRRIQYAMWGIAAASIAVLLCISYLLSRSITRPLKKLAQRMEAVGQGDYAVQIQDTASDEIGELGHHFNDMTRRIQRLMEQVYQEGLLRREADIRALQKQINPHFLYNTLEVLSALNNRGDRDTVKIIIQKLAGLFRYATEIDSAELVSLAREMSYTKDYVDIHQLRYRGLIHYEALFEEAAMAHCVPKFTVQPLVENCLHHGLRERGMRAGHVRVYGSVAPDGFMIDVEDDGEGMALGDLRRLIDQLDAPLWAQRLPDDEETWAGDHTSIGVCNVHARIRLLFGAPYGLALHSAPGKGMWIRIHLPAPIEEG